MCLALRDPTRLHIHMLPAIALRCRPMAPEQGLATGGLSPSPAINQDLHIDSDLCMS
jgi:hypothetical protein